mmetsp:Transcript_12041/g.20362  ORF Transcript_12041/g.20362 Transcript_12041/m.20362 type:complete len:216 (-) Transcript_12041:340-987(-)|eukprot:CAMPEP_0198228566 /NCGR_PEP_ID=MMETSP1445-20131203/113654_1 /TAXON_ID=36898 /ORGANISM="Pyramimonas sp., Strain CCMP2087" /LENGTH=215 /DNA_ID=CAMNT_0043908963 /DNA_START=145 /DNA_END=792 /DNA_ORIENTATION=+
MSLSVLSVLPTPTRALRPETLKRPETFQHARVSSHRVKVSRKLSVRVHARGPYEGPGVAPSRNVLGGDLQCCCAEVRDTGIGTGFFRDGFCSTGPTDEGRHTVCIECTTEFLSFCTAVGNDLSTAIPQYEFPGLMSGDQWCLCAQRFAQALQYGQAPKVYLRSTHEGTLKYVDLEDLKAHAIDLEEAEAEVARLDALRASLRASICETPVDSPEE